MRHDTIAVDVAGDRKPAPRDGATAALHLGRARSSEAHRIPPHPESSMPFAVRFGGSTDTYDAGFTGHITARGGLLILNHHERITALYPAAGWTILVRAPH